MLIKKSNKTAICFKDTTYTYEETIININKFASLYKDVNANKIVVFAENRPEWAFAFYSAWKNKGIAVTIDYMSTTDEVKYILNDCTPEVIFCSIESKKTIDKVLENLGYTPKLLVFEDIKLDDIKTDDSDLEIDNILDTALIIYTSGTTAFPKGVMLSFDNLLANIEAVVDAKIYTEEKRAMILLPLHHALPLMGTLIIPLSVQSMVAFCPSLNSEDIVATLKKFKITLIVGVPRFYSLLRRKIKDKINQKAATRLIFKLCEKIDSKSFSKKIFGKVHEGFGGHLDTLVCGGAALDYEVERDYRTLGFEILVGYGMTECAPMISFPRPGKAKIGASGQSLSCNEIKVEDNEIITRGRNVMQGYFNKPEETAEIMKDGWLYTGDIGHLDSEGYVFITGRKKELIVLSNGKNISPVEIEEKISSISDIVLENAVFLKGDSLQIIIYPDPKKVAELASNDFEEYVKWNIIDKYNQSAAPYKKITRFFIVNQELPRTRLGKIKRYELDKLLSTPDVIKTTHEEPTFKEYKMIRDYLKDLKSQEVFCNDHLELDLGIDSLDKVSFQLFLKTSFGLDFSNEQLGRFNSVQALAEYVKDNKIKSETESINWGAIFKEKVDLSLPKSWFTHQVLKNLSKYFLKFYFQIKGEGIENIPNGPFIIAPNHQSFIDGLFVSIFLKTTQLKETYYYAKEKHVKTSFVKFLAAKHNVIVMDLNNDLMLSLQKLAEVLKRGKNIMIFPEGTRTKDGDLGNFKRTFAILATELNVPVVPVAISGAFEALPTGSLFPKPWKKINVKFLKPIYPKGHSYDSLKSSVFETLTSALKKD
ncbi:MAG: AMP-binding protein [bacterium]